MIYKSPYVEGSTEVIYRDPETKEIPMGTARLREYRSTGLPIILNEASNELNQDCHALEECMIEWDLVNYKLMRDSPWLFREDKPHKLMRLYRTGP